MKSVRTPAINSILLSYKGRDYNIEYFCRKAGSETIVLIHGLGGCKENYWEAVKSTALADFTIIAMDNPGTGNSTYYEDTDFNVEDLAAITRLFIQSMALPSFWLCGTSMGGLTTLLYLRMQDACSVKGYINIEGNLTLEDCMFSSKVVQYEYAFFASSVFPLLPAQMKDTGNTGYAIIANNLLLNTNVHAYYQYSFQTVSYSSTGELLQQYLDLQIPALFIYGDENEHLSYLPVLRENGKKTAAISASNHFVFYDNPHELYQVIGTFITGLIK